MCSGMRNAYCLPPARLLESARENVQENRDIRPFPPLFFFLLDAQPSLISGLSYSVVMGASSGRDLASTVAAGGINLLSLKC